MAAVVVGWDGTCAMHKGFPTIARHTGRDVYVRNDKTGAKSVTNVIEVHCTAGHQYLALDPDDFVDDPFSEDEEKEIAEDEGFPLPPDFGEDF